jgi:chaperonin cofactor prefoldin
VKQSLAADIAGRKKTEAERDQIIAETEALKPKIEAITKQIEEKQTELEVVTTRWTDVKKQVADSGGIDQLKLQLTSLTQQKDSLDGAITELKNNTAAASSRFNELNQTIADLRRQETWQARGIMPDGFRASIVQVDRAYGFITLSAGNNSGVVSGATLDIKRGGTNVGQAKVTNVEQGYAIADVLGVSATEIQVGDAVTVSAVSNAKNVSAPTPAPAAAGTPAATTPAETTAPAAAEAPADPFAATPAETPAEKPAEAPADPFGN